MILDAILLLIYALAQFFILFLSAFGTAELPASITSNIAQYSQYYTNIDNIFPVSEILAIIAIQTTIELSILTYRFVKWTWQKIPSIN